MSMRLRRQSLQLTAESLLAPTAILVSGANSSVDEPFKPLVKALQTVVKGIAGTYVLGFHKEHGERDISIRRWKIE